MGFFSKLFGKNKKDETQEEKQEIFYAQPDERMKEASLNAQQNFKYFWLELYWEYRRIVPALGFAMVKIPFKQQIAGQDEPHIEHMWINNINFDGEYITGELVNEPNQLTNVSKGDSISKKVNEIGDWMISNSGKIYGAFTIQAMRAGMSKAERKSHDASWGLDFGDYNEVLLAYNQEENPTNLIEHPMSINMGEKFRDFLNEHPNELHETDPKGLTLLHKEAIAGNKTSVEIIIDLGADTSLKSNAGMTALDYAQSMGWTHLTGVLGA